MLNKSPELERTQQLLESLASDTERSGRPVEGFIVAGQESVRACAREAEKGQDWAVVRQRLEQQWPAMVLVKVPLFRDPSAPDKNTGELYVTSRVESPLLGAVLFGGLCGTLLGLACLLVARSGRPSGDAPTRYATMVAETAPPVPTQPEVSVTGSPLADAADADPPVVEPDLPVVEAEPATAEPELPVAEMDVAPPETDPPVAEPEACVTANDGDSLLGKPPSAPSPLEPSSPVATGQDPQPPTTPPPPVAPPADRDTREVRRTADPFRETRVHSAQVDAMRAQAMRMAVEAPALETPVMRETKPESPPVERIEASYDHRGGGHEAPAPASPPEAKERRRFKRYDCTITVRYELTLEGTSIRGEGSLDALNVSVGGLKIRARHKLSVGTLMTLQLPLPDGVLRAKAKVVWARPKDNEAGIEFVSLSDEECERLLTALESDGFPPSPFLD